MSCSVGYTSPRRLAQLLRLKEMPLVPPPRQWPRGLKNELHNAAGDGSLERTEALLASGSIDVNMGDPRGWTPLMRAAVNGRSRVVEVLLANGAEVLVAGDKGLTALHASAIIGLPSVVQMLVKAGANVHAADDAGNTALHMAANKGHSEVVAALIQAGSNVNSRSWLDGPTPLFLSASRGRVDTVSHLLRARANALLTGITLHCGTSFVPLDIAAQYGHSEVVRELILQRGITGCGGPSGGMNALCRAIQEEHEEIVAMLTDARVFDETGSALVVAAGGGNEALIRFLFRHQRQRTEEGVTTSERTYVNNARDIFGASPLLAAAGSCWPRVVRMLVDAGADTAQALRVTKRKGGVEPNQTPLALTTRTLRERKVNEKDATQEQLHRLEAVRRLLLQEEAVHAVSWAWTSGVPLMDSKLDGNVRTAAPPTAGTAMVAAVRILRRRARRPDVLFAALHRYSSSKP